MADACPAPDGQRDKRQQVLTSYSHNASVFRKRKESAPPHSCARTTEKLKAHAVNLGGFFAVKNTNGGF